MAEESKFLLSDFVTPIRSGLGPAPVQPGAPTGRLSDERTARVSSRVRALEAARQQAEAESRDYHVR
jgi:hypothetical protein